MADNKYTERQWSRTVGWGRVPDEYKYQTDILRQDIESEKPQKTAAVNALQKGALTSLNRRNICDG